jgi:hypothetical protein
MKRLKEVLAEATTLFESLSYIISWLSSFSAVFKVVGEVGFRVFEGSGMDAQTLPEGQERKHDRDLRWFDCLAEILKTVLCQFFDRLAVGGFGGGPTHHDETVMNGAHNL